jgi:hypothetical protein
VDYPKACLKRKRNKNNEENQEKFWKSKVQSKFYLPSNLALLQVYHTHVLYDFMWSHIFAHIFLISI